MNESNQINTNNPESKKVQLPKGENNNPIKKNNFNGIIKLNNENQVTSDIHFQKREQLNVQNKIIQNKNTNIQDSSKQNSFIDKIQTQDQIQLTKIEKERNIFTHPNQQVKEGKEGFSLQVSQENLKQRQQNLSVSSLIQPLRQSYLPKKLTEQQQIQRLNIINQAIEQDQLKSKLQKIENDKRTLKFITNKVNPQDQEVDLSSNSNSQQIKIQMRTLTNSQIGNMQNSQRNTQQMNNQVVYNFKNIKTNQGNIQNNSNKGTYNFKTSSKNCLEIMKETLEKRQQILERNIPYYAEAKKDIDQILTQDVNFTQYFQSKKRLQQSNIQTQFEDSKQIGLERPNSSQFNNQNKKRLGETRQASQQITLMKSQSNKNLSSQSQNIHQKKLSLHNMLNTVQQSSLLSQSNNFNQFNQYTYQFDDNGENKHMRVEDSKDDSPFSNNPGQIERIRKLHKNVLEMNNSNHLKEFFIPLKSNLLNNGSKHTINSTNLQRNNSTSAVHPKNKSEIYPKKNNIIKKEEEQQNDEIYGPWDYKQGESHIFASFNCFTDRSENNNNNNH